MEPSDAIEQQTAIHALQDCGGAECTVFGCTWTPEPAHTDRPIRGGRVDRTVHASTAVSIVEGPTFLDQMRVLFMALDVEAEKYAGEPEATARALAHMDALLADIRYARDRLQTMTAEGLRTKRIRRLVIEGVIEVEGGSEAKRTDWQDTKLLGNVLRSLGLRVMSVWSGEWLEVDVAAAQLLGVFRAEWRLTALRSMGLDPDDYSTLQRDDETGQPIRTPTVRIVDNRVRRRRG